VDPVLTMPSSGFRSGPVLSLIECVERTDQGTGALICETAGDRLATVLLEEGRICWAVASGMRRRLTDLLLETAPRPLERNELERIYRDCKGRNVPLGEELVRLGVVPPSGLRDALAQHTSEAIVRVGEADAVTFGWVAHRAPGYSPKFTFETLDIALRVADKVYPAAATEGRRVLQQSGLPGIAFRGTDEPDGGAFPVAATRADELPDGDDLTGRGRLFLELRERIGTVGGETPDLVSWRAPQGHHFALGSHGDLTIAHFLSQPTDLGRLLKARMKT